MRPFFYVQIGLLIIINYGCQNNSNRISHQTDTAEFKPATINESKYLLYDSTDTNRVTFDSVRKIRIYLSDSTFKENATIYYKEYSFEVTSYFTNDSVADSEPNLFNPICTKQELSFYYNAKLLKSLKYPVRFINQKVSNNKTMGMLENVINYLGLIKDIDGVAVVVAGWGGCNACSSFEGIYRPDGTSFAYNYGTRYESFEKSGDLYQLIKVLKIDRKEFDQMSFSAIRIYEYPPRG